MFKSIEYPLMVLPVPAKEGGGYLALAPDLLGCASRGETPEGAVAKIRGDIAAWIETAKNNKEPIPKPTIHDILVWEALKQR